MFHQNERKECLERGCGCILFEKPPNYPDIEHKTIR